MKAYKGFDKNMQCRGFQYEEGKTYKTDEKPVRCGDFGFHAVENPLDLLAYYLPGDGSVYREVEIDGKIARGSLDSKVAAQKITIGAKLDVFALCKAAFQFVYERTDKKNKRSSSRHFSASQASGDRSASQASGDSSASQASGHFSASQASGDRSTSLVLGHGSSSEIINTDKIKSVNACAISTGPNGKVRAPIDCWLICAEWDEEAENMLTIKTVKVDGKKIKPDIWYHVVKGKFVKAE